MGEGRNTHVCRETTYLGGGRRVPYKGQQSSTREEEELVKIVKKMARLAGFVQKKTQV
jgi:hypothetical protein